MLLVTLQLKKLGLNLINNYKTYFKNTLLCWINFLSTVVGKIFHIGNFRSSIWLNSNKPSTASIILRGSESSLIEFSRQPSLVSSATNAIAVNKINKLTKAMGGTIQAFSII